MRIYYFLLLFLLYQYGFAQVTLTGRVEDLDKPIVSAQVTCLNTNETALTDADGKYALKVPSFGTYEVLIFADNYQPQTIKVETKDVDLVQNIRLQALEIQLTAVEVQGEKQEEGLRQLRKVEGFGIYAGKKSEVISFENMLANTATNNPRQIFKGVAGLNIQENDGSGLQLSIGARGLDPNRTSNFNTRQNGYDISADALGYPESYYTPPAQALQQIEVVRGAASLQFGPQFGGLLNFILKKGSKEHVLQVQTEQTIGSFGLFNSFNSVGGEKNGWNYYGYFHHKQGDGWRPNSKFEQNTVYASVSKRFNKSTVGLEVTHMNYLAQQAGGLQDFEFDQDPRQSKRTRNWFRVHWNLAALHFTHAFSDKTQINSRSFLLSAGRDALGELGPINRPDPMRERDLTQGTYFNFGNETRLLHRYDLSGRLSTFLAGVRYYQGRATNEQGLANAASSADFYFLNPDNLEQADYVFPSQNVSIFAENLINLSNRWSLTTGLRYEFIQTKADGFFKNRVFSGNQLLLEETIKDIRERSRSILLAGVGLSFKMMEGVEWYTNVSQNYRSINFTDMAVLNPNLIVDSLLRDEHGYNMDVGVHAKLGDWLSINASGFYLRYRDRIGITDIVVPDPVVVEKSVAYRTNIGDAGIVGFEMYTEVAIHHLFSAEKPWKLHWFGNLSLIEGTYLEGSRSFKGNQVELIPTIGIKTGLEFGWKEKVMASYQVSHSGEQFTDATNAQMVVDATRGIIPAYTVHDFSMKIPVKKFVIEAGVNNVLDARYFTRRAVAYPGPGIIPADGRSFYLTLKYAFGISNKE